MAIITATMVAIKIFNRTPQEIITNTTKVRMVASFKYRSSKRWNQMKYDTNYVIKNVCVCLQMSYIFNPFSSPQKAMNIIASCTLSQWTNKTTNSIKPSTLTFFATYLSHTSISL